jgi:dTDP-4-amino-4,6-dideoxygalactose transaminase
LAYEEVRAVTEVLRSGHVAQGRAVEQFERGMAGYLGLQGGVAVSSGTAALEVALRALGVMAGDEVILPSYVCAAPWLALTRLGAVPRLADIERDTYNLNPGAVANAVTARTRAIIVPHLFGLPANLTALQELRVPLIEDCAQTLGAREQGRSVGSVGTVTVCSFYATKLLCTGEGGMVLSNDPALLDRARALREYDGAAALTSGAFNYKMTDLQAAIGICQLDRLPALLARRTAIASEYGSALKGKATVPPFVPTGSTHVYYRYVVRSADGPQNTQDIASCLSRFEARGIQCRKPVFRPLHRYLARGGFPFTDEADATAISIPLHPALTDEDVMNVLRAIREELP